MGRFKAERGPSTSKRGMEITITDEPNKKMKTVKYNATGLRKEMSKSLGSMRKRQEAARDHKFRQLDVPDSIEGSYTILDNEETSSLPNELDVSSILKGDVPVEISHEGGEFLQILLGEADDGPGERQQKYQDRRTRRDRLERRQEGFRQQLAEMTDTYMRWEASLGPGGLQSAGPMASAHTEGLQLQVVDVFATLVLQTGIINPPQGKAAALVEQGLIPCAPFYPTLAITTRVLELFRTSHLRCPHLSVQSFTKTLLDLHGLPYRHYLSQQFTTCYDLYLQLREEVQQRVFATLNRNTGDWRLRNACPACTYKLKGEDALTFNMLVTMDGNDSLKRILRKEAPPDVTNSDAPKQASVESTDTRKVTGDYYLSRETVDHWIQGRAEDAINTGKVADTPCASRWTNMTPETTSKMWGIFDETGVFLALCRHGFVLVAADMVHSGELAKYPLAVVEVLLNAFGAGIGGGYDIGCQFRATLARSGLRDRVQKECYTPLVGSFHGHAHNRLCQLSYLATYVTGMGLEDLEGCERFFSKSNALASSVRYASTFHRRQKIAEFMKHMDMMETSQNLSLFIVGNYKQALNILAGKDDLLRRIKLHGIDNPLIFTQWLEEERAYLQGLSQESEQDVLKMEYYQWLVNLADHEQKAREIQNQWTVVGRDAYQGSNNDPAVSNVTQSHQKLKFMLGQAKSAEAAASDLEKRLNIGTRWDPSMEEWKQAATLVSERRYRKRLDQLELLVVSRLFELSKMNMSQTGYKMRKHISKALQQRSRAIQMAITRYNEAARAMLPERPQLTWEQVMEYAFLADFDLLRGSQQDVRKQPWANQTTRLYMDSWFKIERAEEEIKRLNIEIRRVITHLHDEKRFLTAAECRVVQTDAPLAFQIKQYCLLRMCFADEHIHRFQKLAVLPGFTGSLDVGESIDQSLRIGVSGSESAAMHGEPMGNNSGDTMWGGIFLDGDGDGEVPPEDNDEELDERFNVISVVCSRD